MQGRVEGPSPSNAGVVEPPAAAELSDKTTKTRNTKELDDATTAIARCSIKAQR